MTASDAGDTRKKSTAKRKTAKSATDKAIATELAPAVAIALLDQSTQSPDAAPPALDCLAAGVVSSETDGKVRVQLIFENGAVLPFEMSDAAGAALSKGLSAELPKK
jgi:hypothetical protein